ncbi:cupin domain-containing protein [Streptomyces hygroscopicus]|uniref:cupin domain-containing protein n=1 Tax=Streptomyces hygroscopicus TaxID=1912 RepID=UPI002240C46E|nr:cupin domain-containing protein [Streptomyces hygroscopicus]
MDLATFRRDYWEQRPLLVRREAPSYYADLLTLDDVDKVLSLAGVHLDGIRVVVNGKETPVSQLATSARNGLTNALEALFERYRSGSTIVLNSLDQRWEPLRRLAGSLGAEMSARLQMNVYLTPAGAQGFAPHYDTHDVFVAQVHGTKHWRLASQPHALPLRGQPYDKSQPEPDPEQAFDLRSGDVLYLPRGTVHWATAQDRASVHITIGVHPVLWSDVFTDAMRQLFTEEVRFRQGLPIGFAHDVHLRHQVEGTFVELLDVLRTRLSPSAAVAENVKRTASIGSPTLRGHLTDLDRLATLWIDTRVRRRPGLRWNLTVTDDAVELDFHNKSVRFPVPVADEVRHATGTADVFTANDVPGDLDEPGRLVLIRTLLREGFLTFV